MDNNVFKVINYGTCAYFLMMYSCMMFLIELWYAPRESELFDIVGFFLLMILTGLFLFNQYRKTITSDSESGCVAALSAVKLIGSSVILVIILQLLLRQLTMTMMRFSPQALLGILLFLSIYAPFIIIAVVKIRKGFKLKDAQAFSSSINFLCCRVIVIYLFFTGVYQLLVWLMRMFMISEYGFTSFDLCLVSVPAGSIAVAAILYFAPLHIKETIKSEDASNYRYLSAQSCVTGGYLVLLSGLFRIPSLTNMEFFTEYIPVVLFLISGILLILHGKKQHI